ncbi:MAG: sigma-70 family RNA polymerase sigma factor [Deltaproteobacteria bacterium]|nr:sigma-70 family RNA polymerase sigma factor [Deltaproteobacteria bacterium]
MKTGQLNLPPPGISMGEQKSSIALAQRLCSAVNERWPTLSCQSETIARYLETRDLDAITHPDELALAFLCAQGNQAALGILENEFLRAIPLYISRIDSSDDFADELTQTLRERLLVGSAEEPPKILTYLGSGPLGGWLRVTAVRKAISIKRLREPASLNTADLAELAIPIDDVVTRAASVEPFQKALRSALTRISPRERNVLRLRFVDNWSPEDIGKSYGVHRATIARWIEGARSAMRAAMAEELMATMGFNQSEFDSLVRLVESRLHISLSQLNIIDE